MTNQLYWIWLNSICLFSDTLFSKLISSFGNISEIYLSDEETLFSKDRFTEKQIKALTNKDLTEAQKIYDICKNEKIGIITYVDKNYPKSLKTISNPPVLLFYRGNMPDFESYCYIGTVGTRDVDEYGIRNAYSISYDLAKAGAVVVSGMAKGIDSVCHAAAIEAGGKTVSVLGCGINKIYPAENTYLYGQLIKFGTVISEYPPNMSASKYTFPRRNRIISGISKGTVVIEADEKSGAMITAQICTKQGKTLFTLPHDVGEKNGRGPIKLMKNGAVIAENANDILSLFYSEFPNTLSKEKIPSRQDNIKISRIKSVCKNLEDDFLSHIPEKKEVYDKTYENEESEKNTLYKNEISYYTEKDVPKVREYFPEDFWEYMKTGDKKAKKPVRKSNTKNKEKKEIDTSVLSGLSDIQKKLYAFLNRDKKALFPDEMTETGLTPAEIMSSLTILEIKGIAEALPGGKYKIL